MNQNPAFDSSIPVLTEVVVEPLVTEAPPAEPMDSEPAADIPTLNDALPLAAAPQQPLPAAEPDWDAFEARIVERVLAQLQPQVEAVVRNALASAADQIHIGLRQTVGQMVAQQVAAGDDFSSD